jgi:membrane protein DedA with SNARE-associated domain
LLDFITNFISSHNPIAAYALLFISAFVENIFPPIPGDAVTLFGAYLVGRGTLDLVPVFLSTSAGSFASFMAVYYLGSKKGRGYFQRRDSSGRTARRLEKVDRWFARYGLKLILVNRFLSGVRALVAVSAGIANMPAWKVGLCSFISIAVWNGLIMYAGLTLGVNWKGVTSIMATYSRIILAVITLIAIILLIRFLRKRSTPH